MAVGVAGRAVVEVLDHDRQVPLWLTITCGIAGTHLGNTVYRASGGDGSPGLDWTQGVVTGGAAVLLTGFAVLRPPGRPRD